MPHFHSGCAQTLKSSRFFRPALLPAKSGACGVRFLSTLPRSSLFFDTLPDLLSGTEHSIAHIRVNINGFRMIFNIKLHEFCFDLIKIRHEHRQALFFTPPRIE